MTWEEFVRFLANDETAVVVAVVISLLVEYVPRYDELTAKAKRLVFFGLAFAVPLLGALFGIVSLDWPASWAETVWPTGS